MNLGEPEKIIEIPVPESVPDNAPVAEPVPEKEPVKEPAPA